MTDTVEEGLGVVEMTRKFSAPVGVVYRAFTEVEALAKWGMGKTYENIVLDIDVRPGGAYYNRVRGKDSGGEWTFFGVFQEVEPDKKLSYTFDWKNDWREPPTPSLVSLIFRDRGGTTELGLIHSKVADPGLESTETHWTEFLDVLESMLVSKTIS